MPSAAPRLIAPAVPVRLKSVVAPTYVQAPPTWALPHVPLAAARLKLSEAYGPATTVTVWLAGVLEGPVPFEAVRVTVYGPGAGNAWTGFGAVDDVVSPQFQTQPVGLFVDVSVKLDRGGPGVWTKPARDRTGWD